MQSRIDCIWVPFYICGDFITTLEENHIHTNYYHIDENFEIKEQIKPSESVLYVNYFGIKDSYIKSISKKFKNLIIDNSQALFNKPIDSLPTFYSLRKFIGVPDGGMLATNHFLPTEELQDYYSFNSSDHLLIQADKDTESGYNDFQLNEKRIIDSDISKMSSLSRKIAESVDASFVQSSRTNNYAFLHEKLSGDNNLKLEIPSLYTYPLLVENGKQLRQFLQKHKVYTPQLWSDQLKKIGNSLERHLIENIVHLPIDQRYSSTEMNFIVKLINDYYA